MKFLPKIYLPAMVYRIPIQRTIAVAHMNVALDVLGVKLQYDLLGNIR